jgi:hypothetical protein
MPAFRLLHETDEHDAVSVLGNEPGAILPWGQSTGEDAQDAALRWAQRVNQRPFKGERTSLVVVSDRTIMHRFRLKAKWELRLTVEAQPFPGDESL